MNYLNSLFFIFIFHVFYIYAQLPYYHLLNDENGLPSNEVYRVVEDKKGYVWIGCDAGLYRYNGFEFKLYKHPQQNSRSISYLNFDDAGNLWCANFSGQIFIVKNDSIKLVADYSSLAGKYHFCFNSYSFYWKIDKNNIEKIDINGKTLKKYPINLKNELIGNGTDLLYFKKLLWAEIPSLGFYCFDEKNERFDLLLPYDKNKSYINQRLFTLKDKLYLLRTEKNLTISSDHIYEVNTENKSIRLIIKKDNVKNTRYYSIYEDRLQNLWMASSNGAIKLKNISDWGIKAEPFFQNNKISFILYDSEGNYWFADLQNGVWIIPDMKSIFFKNKPDEPNFDITTLKTLNDSILLLGFYDGSLSFFNTRNNTFTPLDISKKITGITVKDIEVKEDNIYVSRGHFLQYSTKTKQNKIPLTYGNARDLLLVGDTFFCVHPEYVCRFSINDILHNQPLKHEKIIPIGGRKAAYETSTGTLYFALNNGLYTYRNGVIDSMLMNNEKIYVYNFANNTEYIWATTQTQGILQIKDKKIIHSYLKPDDLPDITAKTIFADDNYVWACTNSHFIRIDAKNKRLQTYSLNIGINPRDVTSITKCVNDIFIGTKKSLIQIPFDLEPESKVIPQLFIEKISVNDTTVISEPNFILDYHFSNLKIDFISFSYKSGKNFYYEYRLLGFDSTWTKTSYNNPFAIYSSLPAGNYQFEVRSVNENKLKSDKKSISFTVKKPFWQQAWFYAVFSLISILVVALLYRYQIKKIRKRNEIEKKLILSQLSALKAQMNPHFMYNAINSIQALILEHDIKNSNLYLSKFSNLLRKILDASGKELISLKEEIDILSLYLDLEKLRFGEDFNFTIEVDKQIDEYAIQIPAMLLQPFIENALKHGLLHKKGNKFLKIQFNFYNNHLQCVIEDNGVGRKRSEEIKQRFKKTHQSFATEATDKRVELFNKFTHGKYKIQVTDLYQNDVSTGTRVTIEIPLN